MSLLVSPQVNAYACAVACANRTEDNDINDV